MIRPLRFAVLLFCIAGLHLFYAHAQARPVITGTINDQARVIVRGSRHPLAQPQFALGPVDPSLKMDRILLVLARPQQQQEELAAFLQSQQDKTSPDFHHWLTPEEFGQKFGPAPQDIQKIKAWLQGQGFTVTSVARSGGWIEFSGTAAQVEHAFRTPMERYRVAGHVHVANSQDISLPQALSPAVRGIASLHNFFKKPAHITFGQLQRDGHGTYSYVDPNFTTSNGLHALGPNDFAKIYDVSLNAGAPTGTGETIAIVARSNIAPSDITDFQLQFAVPVHAPVITLNGPDPGFDPNSGESVEATLDTEWSGAVARGATINLVVSSSTLTTDGVDLSAAYIVDNNVAPVMSMSFGACERDLGPALNAFYSGLWQQAAAQGISVFVSSGDSGAAGCDNPGGNMPGTIQAVSGLSSTPFNTSVGGTEFNEGANPTTFWSATNGTGIESALAYIPEEVWNESCGAGTTACPSSSGATEELFAGSGGSSSLYSKAQAPWQNLNGVPVGDGQRDLPDVSLTAAGGHDPYLICFDRNCASGIFFGVGGTSASSPAFAGIMALIDQAAGGRQGLANYLLYKLAATPGVGSCNSAIRTNPATASSGCLFYDTTTGNNTVPGVTGFNAVSGYDKATGLGSVDVNNLIGAWLNELPALATTTTTLAPASITGTHGAPVTVDIQVSGSNTAAPPTGTVSLTTSTVGPAGTNLPAHSVVLSNSAFSGPISDLPGGTYNLTANYSGDAANRASDSTPVTVNISPEASSVTALSFGINSAGTAIVSTSTFSYGSFMNLHAAVAGASKEGIATGTMNFLDGATSVGSASLNQKGEGDLFLFGATGPTALTVGSHTVTANYSGDASFNSSSSNVLNLTITKGNPTVTISAPVIAISGQMTSITVQVANTGPILPTGTVQLLDGATALGPPLAIPSGSNQVPVTLILHSDGSHNITAGYSGDSVYNAATSQPFALNVTAPFVLSGAIPVTPIPAGQTATFNLDLINLDPTSFAGTVALSCSAPAGTTCSLSPKSASLDATTTDVAITLTVPTTTTARLQPGPFDRITFVFAAVFAGLLLGVKKRPRQAVIGILALLFIVGMSSCGGGGNSTPNFGFPTNTSITVTGTSGDQTTSLKVPLTITH